jgi:hypothetical protein
MSNAARKQQIMKHLSASTKTKLVVPPNAMEPGYLPPQAMCDDKTFARRMEHVARSLGNFTKEVRNSAQIIEHLNISANQ